MDKPQKTASKLRRNTLPVKNGSIISFKPTIINQKNRKLLAPLNNQITLTHSHQKLRPEKQGILPLIQKPRLNIDFLKKNSAYLRKTPGLSPKADEKIYLTKTKFEVAKALHGKSERLLRLYGVQKKIKLTSKIGSYKPIKKVLPSTSKVKYEQPINNNQVFSSRNNINKYDIQINSNSINKNSSNSEMITIHINQDDSNVKRKLFCVPDMLHKRNENNNTPLEQFPQILTVSSDPYSRIEEEKKVDIIEAPRPILRASFAAQLPAPETENLDRSEGSTILNESVAGHGNLYEAERLSTDEELN